jgi:hypothetical protein
MDVELLMVDDWQCLYVAGQAVAQNHDLNSRDMLFFLKAAEEYGFKAEDVKIGWVESDDGLEYLDGHGRFPEDRNEFDYEIYYES